MISGLFSVLAHFALRKENRIILVIGLSTVLWISTISCLRSGVLLNASFIFYKRVMKMNRGQLLQLLTITTIFRTAYSYEKEMTVYIDAGRNECFYQPVRHGETIDIEYQVIDGGHGDLDVSFSLLDPIGLVIVSDYKKPENIHRHEANKEGDYRFCFDNTFSSYNRKTVFFELIIEHEGKSAFDDDWDTASTAKTPEELYDIQVHEILEYVGRVHMQIARAHQILNMLRSNEARDRNLAEANYSKVNLWSLFQICAMIAVGFLQVFMVRSIFDTNTRMSSFWKKLGL